MENKMKVYQPIAKGRSGFLDDFSIIPSKKVFRTMEKAEEYKPTFLQKVTTPINDKDIHYLSSGDDLIIKIVELDLED
jgi:hypothetical protein